MSLGAQPFEQLSRQEKASVISQKFHIGRNTVLSATVESMNAAWAANNPALLKRQDGSSLTTPPTGPQGEQAAQERPKQPEGARITEDDVKRIAGELDKGVETRTDGKLAALSQAFDKQLQDLAPKTITIVVKRPDGTTKTPEGRQHKQFAQVLRACQRGDNVWLGGPAGVGKSHMAKQIADLLELQFYRLSCGLQTAKSEVFGHTTGSGGYAPGVAYLHRKTDKTLLLWDEFDRINPGVGVMSNGLFDGMPVTFANGETLSPLSQQVHIVAGNSFGRPDAIYNTANRQDPSTLNRFCKIEIQLDEQLERDVFGNNEWVQYVQKVRRAVNDLGITSLIVTPRASQYGVRALAAGESRTDVEHMYLWAGIPSADVDKIRARVR